ncbi:MAG: hypothetical protein QOJ29_1836 [Thermoleophilaceae bacterium]|nr:hypothetical protein [Thermoleophilaceae bacterium]
MGELPNLYEPVFDETRDEPPFTWRRARVGRQAGSRQLGASLFEVPPGAATFPVHVHWANEELLVVVSGTVTMTAADGTRELRAGDVVAWPAGPQGAHRLDNQGAAAARLLVVSTMRAPEINTYPGTDRLWVRNYAPGDDPPEACLDLRGTAAAE